MDHDSINRLRVLMSKTQPLLDDVEGQHTDTLEPHLIPAWLEPWIGRAYVLAGFFFVIGSVCFLPEFSALYLAGCYFYFAGGAIYLFTSTYDLLEVWHEVGGEFDRVMNELYVAGSIIYLIGTALYLPEMPHILGRQPTELGAYCFIIGSLFFVHACFINGAHTGDVFAASKWDDHDAQKAAVRRNMKLNVLAMTNCTMLGSTCFLVGSVLYLPTIGCEEFAVRVGTWLFIGGSSLFVLAGVLPLVNAQLNKVLGAPTPMYEVVVHGNVRLKRARPKIQKAMKALTAAKAMQAVAGRMQRVG